MTNSEQKPNKPNNIVFIFHSFRKKLYNLITVDLLFLFTITVLILIFRYSFFQWESGDYQGFLKHWWNFIDEKKEFNLIFKERFADYNVPYLYILYFGWTLNFNSLIWIKLVSTVFDVLTALLVSKIVSEYNQKWAKLSYIITLIIPGIFFDSMIWGQCDIIYTYFLLLAFYNLMKKRNIFCFISFGIAISFKLQAIFFLPIYFWLWCLGYFKWKDMLLFVIFSLFPFVFFLVPTILAGRPLLDNGDLKDGLLTIYLNQASVYNNLVMGSSPSLYQWIDNAHYDYFYKGGMIWSVVVVLIIAYIYILARKEKYVQNLMNLKEFQFLLIEISLFSLLLIPYNLPKTHGRYFFSADIFSILYLFAFPKRWYLPIIIILINALAQGIYLLGGSKLPDIFSVSFLPVWVGISIALIAYFHFTHIFKTKSENLKSI